MDLTWSHPAFLGININIGVLNAMENGLSSEVTCVFKLTFSENNV